jgi:hypothetical protein
MSLNLPSLTITHPLGSGASGLVVILLDGSQITLNSSGQATGLNDGNMRALVANGWTVASAS